MALAKLKIEPLSSNLKEVEVLFNPNAYTITKAVTWTPLKPLTTGKGAKTHAKLNAPVLSFGGGDSRQLTLELLFDTTEPIDGEKIDDVRKKTNKIVELTLIERDKKKPPVCKVSWGGAPLTGSDFPFVGVVSNLTQRFTLFDNDGKPVRANLTVVFLEVLDLEKNRCQTDPELTTRVIKLGDTLSSIAAETYRDPTLWRVIAEANYLDDPRRLEIGRRLTVPKLG